MKTGRLVIAAEEARNNGGLTLDGSRRMVRNAQIHGLNGEKWSGYDLRESWQNLLKQWV